MDDKNISFLDNLAGLAEKKTQRKGAGKKGRSDNAVVKVTLFAKKQEINALKERVRAEPFIRMEKVNEIRKLIKNGAFITNSKLVVRSILKNHLLDELL